MIVSQKYFTRYNQGKALRRRRPFVVFALSLIGFFSIFLSHDGYAATLKTPPPIRISETNPMPACVTPTRLMKFVRQRNRKLLPQFRNIAAHYQAHGTEYKVRWDFAFFQTLIETNFLTYRRPNGRWGDVDPKQNNFAGIGTTGGGVPGDSFPDVSTGVLAQLQHLMVYSGEQLQRPVAPRTRLKQDEILKLSLPIAAQRPVTFQDLSGRWAVDKKYGRSILHVANLYYKKFCSGPNGLKPAPRGDTRRTARLTSRSIITPPLPRIAAMPDAQVHYNPAPMSVRSCQVQVAGPEGRPAVLIRSQREKTIHLTALTTTASNPYDEQQTFISTYAKGGRMIGRYASRTQAVTDAQKLCKDLLQVSRIDSLHQRR